jgi:hypothetical protein
LTLPSDQFEYLMGEAHATIDASRKKYDFTGGLIIENEWSVQLDGGRFVIHDRSRNRNLRFSSLNEREVQEAIETIARALSK